MLKAGLCSVTFRKKTPKEIIDLASKAGIQSIEWASDSHVFEGDTATAREVKKMTEDAGMEVSSYGSYFRLGTNTDIIPYLESAKALGTDMIRIWGGGMPSTYLLPDARAALVREAKEISKKAADYGITISTECHAHTITDTPESLLFYMFEVNEPNFRTYWQALLQVPPELQMRSLRTIYASGKLTNLHVYYFKTFENGREQTLLSEASDIWTERFSVFKGDDTVRHAMLEFVREGSDENLIADAKTLVELVNKANS